MESDNLDTEMVKRKFVYSKKYYKAVQKLLEDYDENTFLDDFDAQVKGERFFEVLMQIILDICTHIMANLEKPVPESYAACLLNLAEEKIITKELAAELGSAIKMRNLITHQYENFSYKILYFSLKALLKDFSFYEEAILEWIKKYQM